MSLSMSSGSPRLRNEMAIEETAGDVRAQLEVLVRHLATPTGGAFTQNSFPSSADLDTAIEATEAEILAWFASFGYDIVLANWSVNAKRYIARYNALGAAYFIEMAHTGLVTSPTPGSRAETYYNFYMDLYQKLRDGALSFQDIGVPIIEGKGVKPHFTGGSYDEKQTLKDDTDKVQPLFTRDQFKNKITVPTENKPLVP